MAWLAPATMAKAAPALLAALALAAACGGRPAGGLATVVVATDSGEVTLSVEVADTPEERSQGLMGRASLPERAGMLFRYADEEVPGSFWMKDTLVPLSIAFLDAAGRIVAILDMEPCLAEPCPLYDPGVPYRAALEVDRGAFARLGIEVGDAVTLAG